MPDRDIRPVDRAHALPLLFSLVPVLSLYLRNIKEVPWPQALAAAAASLAIAAALWPATRLVSAAPAKRELALLVGLLLFHTYGVYFAQLKGWLCGWSPPAAHALALAPLLILLLYGLRVLARSPRSLAAGCRAARLAVLLLLAWNLGGILLHHARSLPLWERKAAPTTALPRNTGKLQPDIYCFVMDEFAPVESARTLFGHDHAAFAEKLVRMGFHVAQGSRAPFSKTELALAAILNLGEQAAGRDPYPLIRRNRVTSFLKERGYRIIQFAVSPMYFFEDADQRHYYSLTRISIFYNDFYRALFERSLLRFLSDRWQARLADTRHYREQVLHVFDGLSSVVRQPGPKFVFAHVYSPHEPFVFDEEGGGVPIAQAWNHADPRNYLRQYLFISNKMLEAASLILSRSTTPPIVMFMSDHGYRGSPNRNKRERRVEQAEAQRVFNAILLPEAWRGSLPPALAPSENFRLVFARGFGWASPPVPESGSPQAKGSPLSPRRKTERTPASLSASRKPFQ